MPLVSRAGGTLMKLESRSSLGWPATTAGHAPCTQGLVVHYDGSNQGLAGKDHSACRSYWKSTRQFHMGPSRGWRDIGYSFGVCPHGVVLEGRGWQREQAAQPGGNTTWTSCTFMTGDAEKPTPAQIKAFRQLREWLRGKGLGAAIKGHRDFISTSCPGSTLYSMVKSGALISGDATEEDDDMKYSDSIPVGKTYDADFKSDHYPASFVWVGAYAEAKRSRVALVRVEAKLAAQQATIDKLVDSLSAAAPDLEALKASIREAIESIDVRLDVADEGETPA